MVFKRIMVNGPMDSAWSMFGHDVFHTCRSPYSTENNSGDEIWCVRGDNDGAVLCSAIIDNNGIIYFGTTGSDFSLYALYPEWTENGNFKQLGRYGQTPAIADDGTIFFTTWTPYGYLNAVNPNGTIKWLFAPERSVLFHLLQLRMMVLFILETDESHHLRSKSKWNRKMAIHHWLYRNGILQRLASMALSTLVLVIIIATHSIRTGRSAVRFATGGEIKGFLRQSHQMVRSM